MLLKSKVNCLIGYPNKSYLEEGKTEAGDKAVLCKAVTHFGQERKYLIFCRCHNELIFVFA